MGGEQDMSVQDDALAMMPKWYDSERSSVDQEPERYVVCTGLALLEIARGTFPLMPGDYITQGSQVKTNRKLIQTILKRYGETRLYAREGGRTTRSTRRAAEVFAERLNSIPGIGALTDLERVAIIDEMQRWLAERTREYFDRQHIEVEIMLDQSSEQIVADIIAAAAKRKLAGPVVQHLVGAKLALRYPHLTVENYSATTADLQLGRSGDFVIGDTIFHVTMAPMEAVFDKCRLNLGKGYRAILLVPDGKLQAARQLAEGKDLGGKVGVMSIEAFVGQNVEEMGEFRKATFASGLRKLLETFNKRVTAVETNRSLLIEVPENL